MHEEIVLLSGTSCIGLMQRIGRYLDVEPGDFLIGRFSDGEIRIQIKRNIRGRDVFVIQSTGAPGDNLLELLLLIDAASRASAGRITAVIPYFGYARQDRKEQPRVPISAKLMANLIQTAGASRVLTIDLHADQIQGFFDIPVDNLHATPVLKPYLEEIVSEGNWMVVGPDVGSSKRAYNLAKIMGDLPIALVDKRRRRPNEVESVQVVGEVAGHNCIMVDDIIDTGNTIRRGAEALKEKGAGRIVVAATHGVLSGNAKQVLSAKAIDQLIITNTVPPCEESLPKNTKTLDISPLLAEAIRRIHENRSVSDLFVGGETWRTASLWQNPEQE